MSAFEGCNFLEENTDHVKVVISNYIMHKIGKYGIELGETSGRLSIKSGKIELSHVVVNYTM